MSPYEVLEEQERVDAAAREALDGIAERKRTSEPPKPPLKGSEIPDVGAALTEVFAPGLAEFREARQRAGTELLYAVTANEEPTLAVGEPEVPWFAGLSMEEIHTKILTGKAPGSGQPGGAVLVPEEFLSWLAGAHRKREIRGEIADLLAQAEKIRAESC